MDFYSMWMICLGSWLQTKMYYENDEINDICSTSTIHINFETNFFGGRKSKLKSFWKIWKI